MKIDSGKIINKTLKWCSRYDISILYEVVIYSAAIVGLFSALDYFSTSPSVLIGSEVFSKGTTHKKIINFYSDNGFDLPDTVKKQFGIIGKIPRTVERLYVTNLLSDKEIMACLKNKNCRQDYLDIKIDEMLTAVENPRYQLSGDGIMSEGYVRTENVIREMENELKKGLNKHDYLTFLYSMVFSRTVENKITIENTGDIDLINMEVIIPSPYSRLTQTRENNLLSVKYGPASVYQLKGYDDRIVLKIPKLQIGQKFIYVILTKENSIESNEIIYSFEANRVINKLRAILLWVVLLVIMLALKILFNGKNMPIASSVKNASEQIEDQ